MLTQSRPDATEVLPFRPSAVIPSDGMTSEALMRAARDGDGARLGTLFERRQPKTSPMTPSSTS